MVSPDLTGIGSRYFWCATFLQGACTKLLLEVSRNRLLFRKMGVSSISENSSLKPGIALIPVLSPAMFSKTGPVRQSRSAHSLGNTSRTRP
jgi:hypothetical protein